MNMPDPHLFVLFPFIHISWMNLDGMKQWSFYFYTGESSMKSRNKWTMKTKPVKMFLYFKILIQHFGLKLSEAKQRIYY